MAGLCQSVQAFSLRVGHTFGQLLTAGSHRWRIRWLQARAAAAGDRAKVACALRH